MLKMLFESKKVELNDHIGAFIQVLLDLHKIRIPIQIQN